MTNQDQAAADDALYVFNPLALQKLSSEEQCKIWFALVARIDHFHKLCAHERARAEKLVNALESIFELDMHPSEAGRVIAEYRANEAGE